MAWTDEYRKEWRRRHPEYYGEYQKEWQKQNPDRLKAYTKNYRERYPERIKEAQRRYREKNKERTAARDRLRKKNNPEKIRSAKRAWRKANFKRNPVYNMVQRFRNRVNRILGERKVPHPTMKLLGCDKDWFVAWLEVQFQPGMSWENRNLWHIDHIQPVASFDLSDPLQIKRCFHWTNLQPLWAADNIHKGVKWNSI